MKNQEKYWNSVADNKKFTTQIRLDLIKKYVPLNGHILDVGCGYGRTLDELNSKGYANLTGIDFSQSMIDRGKKEFPQLNFLKNSNGNIPFTDKSFDSVLLLAVLTCIRKDTEQRKLISEIKRVLKPGGIIYINDFLLNEDQRNIDRYNQYEKEFKSYGVFKLAEGAIIRHHSEKYIAELSSCFEELNFQRVVFTTMNGNKSNGFFYIGRK